MRSFALFIIVALLNLGSIARAEEEGARAMSYSFRGRDAAAAIEEALARQGVGQGSGIKVQITGLRDEDVLLANENAILAQADNVSFDRASAHWQATLYLSSQGKTPSPLTLSGHYDEMTSALVLKHRIAPGEVITPGDIETTNIASNRLPRLAVTKEAELIGKTPRHVIPPGRPVREDEIARPALIARGAHVTAFYRSSSLDIRTTVEALDSGAKGDVIRLRNLTSRKIVEGRVENANAARVLGTEDETAELP